MVSWRMVVCCTLTIGMLIGVGCGGPTGPETYPLTGTVNFNGKPVPVGTVTLSPDSSKGNEGPGASAGIKDGAFATEDGRGHVGGAYVIRVTGFDGIPVEGGEGTMDNTGTELFPVYEMTVDLPKSEHNLVIDVPGGG